MSRVVVVGASVAGVHLVQALRAGGHDGEVVLIGEEDVAPYDKPPLSKELLIGEWRPAEVSLLPGSRADDLGVDLQLGVAAVGLDVNAHRLRLADGREVTYDQIAVATGASARAPSWSSLDGVLTLRTLADSERLRRGMIDAERVVVAGAGFIGSEVAAAARARGCEVTVVDVARSPLTRMLGADVGALLGDIHEQHGVRTRFGVKVVSAAGGPGDVRLELDDGSRLTADLVVAGLGAVPNDRWLAGSGLPTGDGVLCDEFLRVQGQRDVFALGDVARWTDPRVPGTTTRVEHWTNAVEQAGCVAGNLLGESIAYEPMHYIWSDQYDWKLQMVSVPGTRHRHEVLGDLAGSRRGVVAYGDEHGNLVAALAVNHPHALMNARRMLRAKWSFVEAVSTLRDSLLNAAH